MLINLLQSTTSKIVSSGNYNLKQVLYVLYNTIREYFYSEVWFIAVDIAMGVGVRKIVPIPGHKKKKQNVTKLES